MNKRVSAWMDGELKSEQAGQLLSPLNRDLVIRSNWDCYHLIGDTMRGLQGPDLCTRICARLTAEPTMLAPQSRNGDEKLGWFASALPAKVAAVAFVAFIGGMALQSQQQYLPQIATVATTEVNQAGVLADERARNYLRAHLQYLVSNGLQGMARYVRVASR
ncbi:MAG: sigma-E factor negative regulatory protein [Betaproteobacteria bacterium]